MRAPASLGYFFLAAAAALVSPVRPTTTTTATQCLDDYVPICANDDTTYSNKCQFDAAKRTTPALEIISLGVCCPIACPLVVAKVCSSTGETYTNACEFLRARCNSVSSQSPPTIVSPGPCRVDCSSFHCDEQPEQPVCGSDYITYRNECALKRAQCESGSEETPWLTSNSSCIGGPGYGGGDTNSEALLGEFLGIPMFMPTSLDGDEGVVTETSTGSGCSGSKFQICANDGTTYDDVCQFVAARRTNETLAFVALGACSVPPTARTDLLVDAPINADAVDQCGFVCPTPELYEPVCTATGAVYQNKCEYAQALCRDLTLQTASAMSCDALVLPPSLARPRI